MIINSLIKDYLLYNGYNNTLHVFIPETEGKDIDRDKIAAKLNIKEDQESKKLPLIYSNIINNRSMFWLNMIKNFIKLIY